jgi:hypothetical protein
MFYAPHDRKESDLRGAFIDPQARFAFAAARDVVP